jgi:hypothetical protein
VVLPLANGSISAPVSQVHPHGDFLIHAPPDYGIMVVVQSLRLRTSVFYNPVSDATFLQCRDTLKVCVNSGLVNFYTKNVECGLD